jgi:hypothetical protein
MCNNGAFPYLICVCVSQSQIFDLCFVTAQMWNAFFVLARHKFSEVEHFCVNVEHFWSGDLAPSPLRPLPPPSLCGSQGRCLPPLLRIPSELDGKPAEGGGGGGGGG